VLAERAIAFELIQEWNDLHTEEKSASLQIKTWQTATYPELGNRPQAIVNNQALDDCDIVLGIFWTRFGSPTGVAESGTEEEIRRSVAFDKPVLLYFSDVPGSPSKIDHGQYQKIIKFRDELRNTGLIWSYSSHDQFRDYLRRHLERAVQKLLSRLRSERITPPASAPASAMHIETNEGIAAHTINTVIYREQRKAGTRRASAPGTIGTDMLRKNYMSYLVRRYNEYQKIGRESFGDRRKVSYSFLSTRVIQVFKAAANDLPLARFDEVVELIKKYIDGSIVGRNNRSKSVRNYEPFDELMNLRPSWCQHAQGERRSRGDLRLPLPPDALCREHLWQAYHGCLAARCSPGSPLRHYSPSLWAGGRVPLRIRHSPDKVVGPE